MKLYNKREFWKLITNEKKKPCCENCNCDKKEKKDE